MEIFQTLGREIEDLWRAENYNEEKLPAIAADALKRADLPSKVSAWDAIEWSLKEHELPRQKDLYGRFGDPPITLFTAPRFYIDIYFWFEGTTSIHQHSFCGAFQVLMGSSIHSWYEFERREAVNAFMEIGDMSLKECNLLNLGDIQQIRGGRQYIHSLFHLDHPSATVVVRTDKSPLSVPQWDYQKPSIAIDPFFDLETTTKKLQSLNALLRAKHPDTERIIGEILETCDLQTAYYVLSNIRGFLRSNPLDQMFGVERDGTEFEGFMDIIRSRHGTRADEIERVFAHRDTINEILRLRGFVTNAEHRFFLALLLNVDGKERIFSLVAERYPEGDPVEKVLDWVYDLSQTRIAGANAQNALGLSDFDEFDMFVFESLLRGRIEGEMQETLRAEYSSEQADALSGKLSERIAKISGAAVFKPLLSDTRAAAAEAAS